MSIPVDVRVKDVGTLCMQGLRSALLGKLAGAHLAYNKLAQEGT